MFVDQGWLLGETEVQLRFYKDPITMFRVCVCQSMCLSEYVSVRVCVCQSMCLFRVCVCSEYVFVQSMCLSEYVSVV